jgi:hypothetical protein
VNDAMKARLSAAAALFDGLDVLALFGSRARGDARDTSDWDFGYLAAALASWSDRSRIDWCAPQDSATSSLTRTTRSIWRACFARRRKVLSICVRCSRRCAIVWRPAPHPFAARPFSKTT